MQMTSPAGPRRNVTLASLAAALAAVAVYAGTLGHGFVFDDGPEVVDNIHIRSLRGAPQVFSTASWEGSGGGEVPMYRPLTTLTYAINYATAGFAPGWFHVVNVLLHALVTVLVLSLALRLGVPLGGALGAALLFAVMPVHVEAVANVAGRKELLVAAFSVGAVLAHGTAVRRGGIWLLGAPVLVACALFSKESGLSALGLIAAHDLFIGREAWKANRKRSTGLYLAYALASAGFVAARYGALGTLVFPRIPFDENPIASAPLATRLMTAVAVLGRGLWLLVLPITLSPDYSFAAIPPVTSLLDPAFLASAAACAAIVAAAVAWRRRFPIGLFAVAWYAISILPGSNLLVPIGTIFGERLLYVPSVALALVAGAGAATALQSRFRQAAFVVGAAVLVAYSARTLAYAAVWSDEVSLFTAAANAQPRSAKAQRMLGGALVEAGRPDEAQLAFERAIAVLTHSDTPPSRMSQPLVELSVAFEKLGRPIEAEATLLRTLGSDPTYPDALWRLGVLRWRQGRRSEAVDLWIRAVASAPLHARAMNDLGIAAMVSGDLRVAEEMWLRSAASDPTLASPLYRLGNLYERQGRTREARGAWTEFLARAHETYPEWRTEVAAKLGTSAAPR
jgi:tetratricopeptide (TPR) repeat protein